MAQNHSTETQSQQENLNAVDDQQQDGMSIADIFDFLRVRFVQLLAIAVITGMISLGLGYFIRMGASTTKLGTYEFAFAFDGASENRYPNGIPFSPQDVLAAPVLDAVYATMNLQDKMKLVDFRSNFTIARGGLKLSLLQSDFEQKLSNSKLTAAERASLETQYRAALSSLKIGTYLLTGDFTKTALSDIEIERILVAIPAAWADYAQKTRGVALYDISIPSMNKSDELTNDSDYLIAAETLRSMSMRTSAALTALMKQPGAALARDTTAKGIDDLFDEVEASYRVDVLPTYTNFLRLADAQDSARVNEVFSNRIASSERAVQLAEEEAKITPTAFQNYILLSSGGTTGSTASPGMGMQPTNSGGNIPMINLNADFFDRIIGQGIAAKDTDYRQKFNDAQLKIQNKVLLLKSALNFELWLLEQIRPNTAILNNNQTEFKRLAVDSNGSQSSNLPSGTAPSSNSLSSNELATPPISIKATLISAQAVQVRLAKFAERTCDLYEAISARNLNAASVLYNTQSAPMVFVTSAISIKNILTATVAAELVVLGVSVLFMASRRRKYA